MTSRVSLFERHRWGSMNWEVNGSYQSLSVWQKQGRCWGTSVVGQELITIHQNYENRDQSLAACQS
jgi:hypothetical protein